MNQNFVDIIDLSAYLEIDLGTQALFEQLIPLFPFGVDFVANIKYEKEVREKLRFITNMRDLNQKIREVFVDYIDEVGQLL